MKWLTIFLISTAILFAGFSVAKPGADVSFVDQQVISVQPKIVRLIELQLFSSADELDYILQPSDGLTLRLVNKPIYVPGEILTIPVEIEAQEPGRFYLHLHVVVKSTDGDKSAVISRIVSCEGGDVVTSMHKIDKPTSFHLLPSSEVISNDE